MDRKKGRSPGRALPLLLALGACSTRAAPPSDLPLAPVDAGLPDSGPVDLGPPPGCTWDEEIGCWHCCPTTDYLAIGCRAQGDCVLFCSRKCLAPGYTECGTWDPKPSGLCEGFKMEWKRPFSRCTRSPSGCYGCMFCIWGAGQLEHHLVNPATGECTCFSNTCTPRWTQYCFPDAGPWPDAG